jgi:Uma2 family endonuclease
MPAVAASELIEAIQYLPPRAAWLKTGVSWEEYEELLKDLAAREMFSVQVVYDQGKMEVMPPPTKEHERPVSIIVHLVIAPGDELGWEIESVRSTRLKRHLRAKGVEPDEAYYVRDIAPALVGGELGLTRQPPPHLVVEVDLSSASLDKFGIYAPLGVPEIWRWHQGALTFYELVGEAYHAAAHSRAFPFLDAATLTCFVKQGLSEGGSKAANAFHQWLRRNLPTPE